MNIIADFTKIPVVKAPSFSRFSIPSHQISSVSRGAQASSQLGSIIYSSGFQQTFAGTQSFQKITGSDVKEDIHDVVLRLKITETNSANVQLLPSPLLVDRIEVWQGSKRELFQIYGEEILYWTLANCPQAKIRTTRALLNIRSDNQQNFYDTEIHPQNTSRYYYIPLSHALMSHFHFNPKYVDGDLVLRVYFASSVGLTGSVSSVRLDEMALLFQTNKLETAGAKDQALALYKSPREHHYLRAQQILDNGSTWTAGSTVSFTLEALKGRTAFLMFHVNNSQSNFAALQNMKLPDTATVQLTTPSGDDVLFSGSPLMVRGLNEFFMSDQFNNLDYINERNIYFLPICKDIQKAMVGIHNGDLTISGSKHAIKIALPAAGTACVQTIDHTNTPTSGFFKLHFRGSVSDSLAHNASASAIQTAFNAMKSAKEYPGGPLTVTVNQAASAGDMTFTFATTANPYVQVNDLVQLVSESTTAASPTYSTSSITTYAAPGWSTGTYYITIYAYMRAKLLYDGKGVYKPEDIVE